MILSASQPYFAPYPGYFQKIMLSDTFVLLDGVQFPFGTTWISRNRFKNDQGTLWMTIPVWKKGLGFQKISDVKICHERKWATKHLSSLKTSYRHAPFFEAHLDFIENLFRSCYEGIAHFNLEIIQHILSTLNIKTEILLLSELGIVSKGSRLLTDICGKTGAGTFLAQSSAKKYLNADIFKEMGVHLKYFNPSSPVYPQLWGPFVANLSILDMLFNCGPKSRDIIRKGLRKVTRDT